MRGLCHTCFRSGVELTIVHGEMLCEECVAKKIQKTKSMLIKINGNETSCFFPLCN